MKHTRLLAMVGSVCLTLVLLVSLFAGCAPEEEEEVVVTPEEEEEEEEVQVEPIEIMVNSFMSSGSYVDVVNLFKEKVESCTGGRYKCTLILGEAMVPGTEVLSATGDGVFDVACLYAPYYKSDVPVFGFTTAFPMGTVESAEELWMLMERMGLEDVMEGELNKWNTHLLDTWYYGGTILMSTVPVDTADDVAGLKVRASGSDADLLTELGASAIYIAGDELYTALATGLVDAAAYAAPLSNYKYGFHEVTKYWVLPSLRPASSSSLMANMDFWNNLPDEDKAIIENCASSIARYMHYDLEVGSLEVFAKIQEEAGVTIVYWDADSILKGAQAGIAAYYPEETDDPASIEALEIILGYLSTKGIID